MSNKKKFVAALMALLAMAIVASRQLFLSVVTRDSTGLGTVVGRSHLWFALGAGISALIATILMFRFFGLHEKMKWSKVKVTPAGPLLAALGGNPFINTPAPVRFDREHWALANPWLSEGQADDRIPMDGSVKDRRETSSGQRSFARRTHQLMFSKWSRTRHD
jgi:hypothetical protein